MVLQQVQAELVHALIKLQPDASLQQLQPQLQQLQAAKAPLAALKPLWMTITAAAAASSSHAAAASRSFVKQWISHADLDSAELAADLTAVHMLHAQQAGQHMQV